MQYGSLKSKIVSLRQIKISQWIIIIQSFCNKQEKINSILPSYLCQSCCFLSIFPSLAVFFFSLFMQQLLVLDYYNWGKNMIKTLEKMSWEKGHIKTAKANIMSVMPTAYYHEKLLVSFRVVYPIRRRGQALTLVHYGYYHKVSIHSYDYHYNILIYVPLSLKLSCKPYWWTSHLPESNPQQQLTTGAKNDERII